MSTVSRPPSDPGRRVSGPEPRTRGFGTLASSLSSRRRSSGESRSGGFRSGGFRSGGSRLDADCGAASVLILALGLVMIAAGLAGSAIGNTRVARHRAHNAADLGALAGAMHAVYGEPDACARAARFVTANGGRLVDCAVTGLEIVVRVEVEVRPLPGLVRRAEAVARAGPVYAPPG